MNALKLLKVAIFVASSVEFDEQIVNGCCRPPQVYNKQLDRCEPQSIELTENRSTVFNINETSEFLILSKGFVKQLDGHNETEIKFKTQFELPQGPQCSDGFFIATFCTAENTSVCPEDATPLLLTTRAQLKINAEYYSPKELCIIGGDGTTLEIRVCNPVCSAEVPCVRKCCDMDQVWNFQNGRSKVQKRCTLSGKRSWRPHFYSSGGHPVPKDINDRIHPHYFIAHPKTFYKQNKTWIFTHEQRDSYSKKLRWIFHIGLNKNYYLRKSRYSWTHSAKFWDSSCVDGVINSGYRGSSEFQGLEEENVLIETFPIETADTSEASMSSVIGVYSLTMIISAVFLLITFGVHVLLWQRQTLHGWTLMSYCASLFLTYVFFLFKFVYPLTVRLGPKAEGLCVFIGFMGNFFYVSSYCWLTVQNFELWWTFRKVQVRPKSSLGVRRYLAYAAFALALPLVLIAVGLTLDSLYVDEPETSWIIPEYGLHQCGPRSELALWVYQIGPAGILFVFNLMFFAGTAISIYEAQREAKFASSSSSRNPDVASRAKLFCKLLIAMGVPYIFEFVSFLAEGYTGDNISWYWIIFDVLNIFQGVFIFIIFVCKKEIYDALKKRYGRA